MPPDFYITTLSISKDELRQIFPWFEDLLSATEEKPKTKRGRKQKPKQVTDNAVEMKASK